MSGFGQMLKIRQDAQVCNMLRIWASPGDAQDKSMCRFGHGCLDCEHVQDMDTPRDVYDVSMCEMWTWGG